MKDWIPLINKLVWPVILILIILIFLGEVKEFYGIIKQRVQSGAEVSIGGMFHLGQLAKDTSLESLSKNISIRSSSEGVAGIERVMGVTKGGVSHLEKLQYELREDKINLNALLITEKYDRYSISLLKQYISSLSLKYIVFEYNDKFKGWMYSSAFVSQFPDNQSTIQLNNFNLVKNKFLRVNTESIEIGDTAKDALQLMKLKGIDSLAVVDKNEKWLFFVEREQILADLISALMFDKKN